MKKLILAVVFTAVFMAHYVQARVVGTNPNGSSSDVFCVGGTPTGSTNEVCIDSTGNLINTTTATGSLGTSSLAWKDTRTGTLTATGASTLATVTSSTITVTGGSVMTSTSATSSQGAGFCGAFQGTPPNNKALGCVMIRTDGAQNAIGTGTLLYISTNVTAGISYWTAY